MDTEKKVVNKIDEIAYEIDVDIEQKRIELEKEAGKNFNYLQASTQDEAYQRMQSAIEHIQNIVKPTYEALNHESTKLQL